MRRRIAQVAALIATGSLVVGIGAVVATAPIGATPIDAPAASGAPGTSHFVPLGPIRLVDTRQPDVGPLGMVAAGAELVVSVDSLVKPDAGRPVAVAVNITATESADPGYVTAWATGRARPNASNLNVEQRGATVPNFAIVPVGEAGEFSLTPSVAAHLIVDVAGVFVSTEQPVASGRFAAVVPSRLLDTRLGSGGLGPFAAGETRDVAISGRAGVPAGAAAAVVTLTATEAAEAGYVSAWPAGSSRPTVSHLNIPAPNSTVANMAIVPLGTGGAISLFAERGTDLLVDVVGWITGSSSSPSSDGLFVPVVPDRQLDTRQVGSRGALLGGYRADLSLRTPAGLSPGQVAAVAANLTVTATSAPLFVTAYPARTIRPETSSLNADRAGQTVAAFSIVPVGAGTAISLRPFARTHAIVDVAGYFLGSPAAPDPSVSHTEPSPSATSSMTAFDEVIDEFLGANGYAGASVAVARDDRIVYARGYGLANAATREPVRVEHHFRIASQSKFLTGITFARLFEQGVVSPNQRVWPLLNVRLPRPPGADSRLGLITIEQLLTHESGFPAAPDPFFDDGGAAFEAFGPAGPLSCLSGAGWMLTQPMETTPGTRYRYANVNYCLLGLLIEAVTGRAWSEVVTEEVLRPSGVVDMYLGRTYSRSPLDVAHVTPSVSAAGGGYFMESIGAAGAWMGTPTDIVRVAMSADELMTAPSLADMRARRGTDPDGAALWYGRGVVNYRSGAAYGHTGALQGSRTMVVHEANGLTWAIMVNARFSNHAEVLLALMDRALATVPTNTWPSYDLNRDLP